MLNYAPKIYENVNLVSISIRSNVLLIRLNLWFKRFFVYNSGEKRSNCFTSISTISTPQSRCCCFMGSAFLSTSWNHIYYINICVLKHNVSLYYTNAQIKLTFYAFMIFLISGSIWHLIFRSLHSVPSTFSVNNRHQINIKIFLNHYTGYNHKYATLEYIILVPVLWL